MAAESGHTSLFMILKYSELYLRLLLVTADNQWKSWTVFCVAWQRRYSEHLCNNACRLLLCSELCVAPSRKLQFDQDAGPFFFLAYSMAHHLLCLSIHDCNRARSDSRGWPPTFSSWKQSLTRSDLIPVPGGLCQFPEMDACSKHERQATLCMVIYPIILTWFVGTYHLCKISKPSQRRVNISTEFPVHSGLRSERMTHLGDWQPTQLNHFDHLLQNSDPFFIFLFQHVTFGELGNLVTWADHCDLPNILLLCRNGM